MKLTRGDSFIRVSISLLIIICLTSHELISQNTINYYVSPTGSDANPGTSDAPFKTIQYCIDRWDGVNQFICNCSGTFTEKLVVDESGPSVAKRNKIIAWDTNNDGLLMDETFILDGENTRNIGLANKTKSPYTKPDNIEVAYMHFMNFFPNGGCNTEDSLTSFIDLSCPGGIGCTDWWVHHCKFENIGYKSDAERCNAQSHFIAIKPTNAARMVIEENSFKNIYAFLMRYIDGQDIKFLNNYVEIATTGIKGWGDSLTRMVISGNTFVCDGNGSPSNATCLGQNAINLSNNAQHALISNNTFYDCVNCIHFGTDEDFGVRPNIGHIVENNVIHWSEKECNKFSAPIVIDDCTDVSRRTEALGAHLYVSDITFRNNVINYAGVHALPSDWNQGPAFELESGHPWGEFSNNIHIYNNTIKGFYWGIRFTQCRIGSTTPANYPANQLNSVNIKNNIFTDLRDAQYTVSTNGVWNNGALPSNIISNYNSFYGKDRFKWITNNKTLSQWQLLGFDLNSTFCKPSFVDTITLRLASNDVCAKDKGYPLPGVTNDIDNDLRPNGANWDLGADEFINNVSNSFKLVAKAVLGGAYFPAGDTMSTSLRGQNLISSKCPFDTTISLAAIPTNMVDWVRVDLVDTLTGSAIYSSTCVCLLNNGLIQNTTGDTMITFNAISTPIYSLRIKHRNHLSARSKGIAVVPDGLVTFDFRTGNNLYIDPSITGGTYHNIGLPEVLIPSGGSHPSRYALWPGDANGDGQVKYQGSANDRGIILSQIGGTVITNTISGYLPSDMTLNGQVKYQGSGNDRALILSSIGGTNITKVSKAHN